MVVLPLYGRTLTVPCCSPFVDLPEGITVSDSCMDLLRKMLTKDATKRPSAREVLAHPWLAKYDAGERISFTPVDVEKLRPPAALFLPPRIGDATKPVTVESIRHIGWLRKRGRLFSVSHQPVVCGLRCLVRFAHPVALQTWRKRFFELNGTDLTYFDKEEEGRKLKGEVDCALVRGLVLATVMPWLRVRLTTVWPFRFTTAGGHPARPQIEQALSVLHSCQQAHAVHAGRLPGRHGRLVYQLQPDPRSQCPSRVPCHGDEARTTRQHWHDPRA